MLTMSWAELKAIVISELDLAEEVFTDDEELRNYANKGIDEAEQHVMSIYQDYFRKKSVRAITQNVSAYTLPADIYANKIRHVHYVNGSLKYRVDKIKPQHTPYVLDNDNYRFDIDQDVSTGAGDSGVRFTLYPASRETGNFIHMWYIRNANRLTGDSSVIDIPEAVNYLRAYIAREVTRKEMGPLLMQREQDLAKQEVLLKQTLDQMSPDDEETLEEDMSFYQDFNTQFRGDY